MPQRDRDDTSSKNGNFFRIAVTIAVLVQVAFLTYNLISLPLSVSVALYTKDSQSAANTIHQGNSEQHQQRQLIPLPELARSYEQVTCPEGFVAIKDTVLESAKAWEGGRRIPKIVHMTSKSRCMLPEFAELVEQWRFEGHSLFLHDDEAMDVLLKRSWKEFPHLQNVMRCMNYGGAALADIWRLLVMWEYGGIYTDIDNVPNKFNGETLAANETGFFQIESGGIPSQWFFAVAPRHPMMYHSIMSVIQSLSNIADVGHLPVVGVTGPGALANGIGKFCHHHCPKGAERPLEAGLFEGPYGFSVRAVGNRTNQHEWVRRAVIKEHTKADLMEKMGMEHTTRYGKRIKKVQITCQQHTYTMDWNISTMAEDLIWKAQSR